MIPHAVDAAGEGLGDPGEAEALAEAETGGAAQVLLPSLKMRTSSHLCRLSSKLQLEYGRLLLVLYPFFIQKN